MCRCVCFRSIALSIRLLKIVKNVRFLWRLPFILYYYYNTWKSKEVYNAIWNWNTKIFQFFSLWSRLKYVHSVYTGAVNHETFVFPRGWTQLTSVVLWLSTDQHVHLAGDIVQHLLGITFCQTFVLSRWPPLSGDFPPAASKAVKISTNFK